MAGSLTITNTFNAQAGPIPLSQLDANFAQGITSLNTLLTFSNPYVDTGIVNAMVVTVAAPQAVSYVFGLTIQVQVGVTNTAAATININGLGAIAIANPDASALSAGQLVAGMIVTLFYDGTRFQIQSGQISRFYGDMFAKGVCLTRYTTAQQNRTSTITLADDTYMVFASVPAGAYSIRGLLRPQGAVTGTQGFQWALAFAGGISGSSYLTYNGIVNGANQANTLATPANTTVQFSTIQTSATDYIIYECSVETAAPGKISFQWSQKSSSVNATLLQDHSYMTIMKLN